MAINREWFPKVRTEQLAMASADREQRQEGRRGTDSFDIDTVKKIAVSKGGTAILLLVG
jgi:hypothetical protein